MFWQRLQTITLILNLSHGNFVQSFVQIVNWKAYYLCKKKDQWHKTNQLIINT